MNGDLEGMDPVNGQGLFRGAVLCRHSYGGHTTVATMNLRLVCVLARPFYQPNEFHYDYTCAFRSAGYRRLRERG